MKRRILISLLVVLALSTVGAGIATLSIWKTIKTATDLTTLHQIEDLRQRLIISIQTAQSDLYTVRTELSRNLDLVADDVNALEQRAEQCSGCHHTPAVAEQLAAIRQLVDRYETALSAYITAAAGAEQLRRLKADAAASAMKLLIKTEDLSARASARLDQKTRSARAQLQRAWTIILATLVLTFGAGIVVAARFAASITRPIDALVNGTRALARGDLGHAVDEGDRTEFGELAAHFNRMSSALKESYGKLETEIAERRRIEAALRASERGFRALFEQAAAGVAQIETATGRFIRVNRRYCEITGYGREEMLTMTFQQITHPEDLAKDLDRMEKLRAGAIDDFSIEKRYLRKDGGVIWASITVSPLWLPGEEPRYNIGVVLDITERKRIETELHESHARYRQLFETAPVSTMEADFSRAIAALDALRAKTGASLAGLLKNNPAALDDIIGRIRIVEANQAALRLFGAREKEDLLGAPGRTLLPESRDVLREQLLAMAEGRTSFEAETVRAGLDGRRIDVIQHVQAADGAGRMDRVLESHTDITALKHAERSLSRSKDFIATVMNSIDPAIAIIDAASETMLGCNASFLRETGFAEADVVGKPLQHAVCTFYRQVTSSSGPDCVYRETLRTGRPAVGEHVCASRNGAQRHYEVRAFPVKDDAGTIVQIIHLSQDITLRKEAEEARLREQELRRLSAERQVVETQLRMLQAQIEPHFLFNTLAHIITLIPAEPDRAAKMLQHLTETLRVSLQRTRQAASTLGQEMDLLRDFLDIHRMRMENRLAFSIDLPEELRALPFPPLLLQPLVENAVIHGIEPSVEGGAIAIAAERTGDLVRLRVSDTGRGFADTKAGSGVGLANVRERLEALFGSRARLILSEQTPRGLTATIEVPYEPTGSDR